VSAAGTRRWLSALTFRLLNDDYINTKSDLKAVAVTPPYRVNLERSWVADKFVGNVRRSRPEQG
jgi:hypothetical protein